MSAARGERPPEFQPAWWCRNRHLQTVWGPLFRRSRLRLTRERVWLGDGDFVDLDWAPGPPDAPLLLVLHGLEGSSASHYAAGLAAAAGARGFVAAVLNFRSCSGNLNRLPRFYHSGETGDLDEVVGRLVDRRPGVPIGAVGVSLGGNVLLKWLGERGRDAPAAVVGAVAISTPFDLAASARCLDRGLARWLYTRRFLRSLCAKVERKAAVYPGFVDLVAVRRARTFGEYDRLVTAPLHGFRDEVDYWIRASSRRYLHGIRRPTLLLSALDDPLVPSSALPDASALGPHVQAVFTRRGGHAGFLEGAWPWRATWWAERRALEFLDATVWPGRPRPGGCRVAGRPV
jgi:predicted alpha/beta-fold hydrolase